LILGETLSMRAYSKDLRVKVLEAVDRGMPRAEIVGEDLRDLLALDQTLAKETKRNGRGRC
jgi:hypothetical protein